MLYYLWYWLGYEMDEDNELIKKEDEEHEKYIIEIKKDAEIYFKKEFDKKYAYKDVVEELRQYLKPIEY